MIGKTQINAKSQKIYESMIAKQKIQKGGMSHQDYLINRGKQYEQKRQMEKEQKGMEDLVENKERLRSLYICP